MTRKIKYSLTSRLRKTNNVFQAWRELVLQSNAFRLKLHRFLRMRSKHEKSAFTFIGNNLERTAFSSLAQFTRIRVTVRKLEKDLALNFNRSWL